jgi:hypothetical protein
VKVEEAISLVQSAIHYQQIAVPMGLRVAFSRYRGKNAWDLYRGADLLGRFDNLDELRCWLNGYREAKK